MAEADRTCLNSMDLLLPPCSLPRARQRVTWYSDSMRREGTLVGHCAGARPLVSTDHGYSYTLGSFAEVRPADPMAPSPPAWAYLDKEARIAAPLGSEKARFLDLLNQHIPPGPTYLELVQEIWSRGFEVFLVGGTVRDVLSGQQSKDVDLVTTMPLTLAAPLLATMFRAVPTIKESRGFVRLGGTPASKDPFIDLKSFVYSEPGTANAIFSGDFPADLRHRDFACNAVYYDPINHALIDPCGKGIDGAASRQLSVVCDHNGRPPYYLAQVAIRFFKFVARGFEYSSEVKAAIETHFLPALAAMKRSQVIVYTRTQLFSKSSGAEGTVWLERFEASIRAFGADGLWTERFEPLVDEIMEASDAN